jgi:hypothetical protein
VTCRTPLAAAQFIHSRSAGAALRFSTPRILSNVEQPVPFADAAWIFSRTAPEFRSRKLQNATHRCGVPTAFTRSRARGNAGRAGAVKHLPHKQMPPKKNTAKESVIDSASVSARRSIDRLAHRDHRGHA